MLVSVVTLFPLKRPRSITKVMIKLILFVIEGVLIGQQVSNIGYSFEYPTYTYYFCCFHIVWQKGYGWALGWHPPYSFTLLITYLHSPWAHEDDQSIKEACHLLSFFKKQFTPYIVVKCKLKSEVMFRRCCYE